MERLRKILAAVFAVLALSVAAFGAWAALTNRNAAPVLVEPSEQALDTAQRLLQAVSEGDYERAEGYLLGNPSLGIEREAESQVGRLVWEAYQKSLTFTPEGESYATASGIAQDYRVRYLKFDSVTEKLRERSQLLLEQRVETAEDISDVYDENNNYREDVVMEVLEQAAEEALREDAVYTEVVITVNLTYQNGTWFVLANEELLSAISGGLAG